MIYLRCRYLWAFASKDGPGSRNFQLRSGASISRLRKLIASVIAGVVFGVLPATHPAGAQSAPMVLVVDESQTARRLNLIHEEIPVRPGRLALAYPRWIPGEHGPTGPIEQFAYLRIKGGSTTLHWERDQNDINTINVEIPGDVDRISVDFTTLFKNTISDRQLLLAWNTVILYPLGIDKRELNVAPSAVLPAGWHAAGSLVVANQNGSRLDFVPLSLERLIDSPLLAGEFLRTVPLASRWPAELDITADRQETLDAADEAHAFRLFTQLVDQDRALFGYRHWTKLHLLVSESDADPFDGLEHEDAPYSGIADRDLSTTQKLEQWGWWLFAHEQSHSWDGKYRRPAEMYSKPDYQGPEQTSLLWVYEGLNEYLGNVLATRAGFNQAAYMRDHIAAVAASFTHEAARSTTPLVDTATENWVLRDPTPPGWYSYRRGQDYYEEGALCWLGADTLIRRYSHNRRSLDDFVRSFFGQQDTGPIVVPYTRDDVERGLAAVLPYDWHAYFQHHVYEINAQPPTDGLQAAGWRVVYNAKPSLARRPDGGYGAPYSLGLSINKESEIVDVVAGSPADAAGLSPQMSLIAVNGRAYSSGMLEEAIKHPPDGKIALVIRNFDSIETRDITYTGGIKVPHLERIPGTRDYLSDILKSR